MFQTFPKDGLTSIQRTRRKQQREYDIFLLQNDTSAKKGHQHRLQGSTKLIPRKLGLPKYFLNFVVPQRERNGKMLQAETGHAETKPSRQTGLQINIRNMDKEVHLKENLAYARKRQGLRQYELAAQIGVKPNTISNYEKGVSMPDLETLGQLKIILNVSADDLVFTSPATFREKLTKRERKRINVNCNFLIQKKKTMFIRAIYSVIRDTSNDAFLSHAKVIMQKAISKKAFPLLTHLVCNDGIPNLPLLPAKGKAAIDYKQPVIYIDPSHQLPQKTEETENFVYQLEKKAAYV